MPNKRNKERDGLFRRPDSPYWWASYISADGRRTRRSTGTTVRKEAEAILSKWRVEAFRVQHWDEQPSRTFDELMLAYVKATERKKRDPVRDRDSLKHLYPVFSGRDLSQLAQVDVRGYIAMRATAGAAGSTINKEVGLLSSAINYARREWGWDLFNPAAGCRQSEPEGRVRWITRAEAVVLVQAAQHDRRAAHLPALIQLALHTGCRKGEMLGLEWRRVDLQRGQFYLEAQHTKTARRRSVPLNREARAALMNRARFRAAHCPASPWVFCHKDGTRIQDVKRSFPTACRRAGIKDFRFHDLRHTCAAWLVTAGVPLAEVRDLLGHRSIQMTERYAHLAPENVRAAVTLLEGTESRLSHVAKTG